MDFLVVAVPDFAPAGHDVREFYKGPPLYYPKQARMYADFLQHSDIEGDSAFPRLLRHLRDKYDLLKMARGEDGVLFRFWGYQGLAWVRDFASNCPVELP